MKKSKTIDRDYLETIPEEDLAELIAMADQIATQQRKVTVYTPNSVQDKVHKSPALIRCLFSGNGVGKTTACINEAIWTSTGTHPYRETARIPNTIIIVLDDASKADSVYIEELKKKQWYDFSKLKLDKKGRSHTQEVLFPSGSKWMFMTHEMAIDKFESIQCACIIFDEPPPRWIYIALLRGMREIGMNPWIMFAGTPRGRHAPWMYKEIFRPWKLQIDPDIECFFGSTHDNLVNLDPNTIKRWEGKFTANELKTRLYGNFEFLSGRIFDGFDPKHHTVKDFPWPRSWPCIIAVDPHLRKNHTALLIGVDNDGDVWVVKELETSLAGRAAARFFIECCEPYTMRAGICDNFGSCDMFDGGDGEKKSFITLWNEECSKLRKFKCMIRPTSNKEKRDDEWIEDMRDWLRLEDGKAKIHVFKSCAKLIDNFDTYVWDEFAGRKADAGEPKEAPLGTNQDFLMCLKYGLAMKPQNLINAPRVISHREQTGRAQEYESHEASWYKD